MPKHIAEKETRLLLKKLDAAIQESGISLRQLCEKTMAYDIPERIHHPTLSKILNSVPDRNLYLQQFLMLTRLLGTTPETLILGKDAAAVAHAFKKLDSGGRKRIVQVLQEELQAGDGSSAVSRKLDGIDHQ